MIIKKDSQMGRLEESADEMLFRPYIYLHKTKITENGVYELQSL
jgi:hypothetical protein